MPSASELKYQIPGLLKHFAKSIKKLNIFSLKHRYDNKKIAFKDVFSQYTTTSPINAVMKQNNDNKPKNQQKCERCFDSKCCTYLTQHIDTPRSKREFSFLLWQISHRNVQVYKDEEGWFLLFNSPCQHLQENGDCGIYTTRPFICREYTNDYCEFDAPAEGGFQLHFKSYEELLAYCKKRFKRWDLVQ